MKWKKAPQKGGLTYIWDMKKCNTCDTELIVGENITQQLLSNYMYRCKSCRKKKNGWGDIKGRPKIYHTETQRKQAAKEAHARRRSKEKSGIYCFKNRGKIVYIGESVYPTRRRESHLFSNRSKLKEELKGCEWEMMEYVGDKYQRLIREFELIYEHKPKYNFPYRV